MATKRNPEERPATGPDPEAERAAHSTGEEVKRTRPRPAATRAKAGSKPAAARAANGAEKTVETAHLDAIASEYYGRLTDAAEQLSKQTRAVYDTCSGYVRTHRTSVLLGATAVGLAIGVLSRRK